MDRLLSLMEEDKKFRFHLDAQTIVLRDYLEIRPEKEAEIKSLVKEGRLLIGPWYVQNDLHLTSGEATVRNLLLGKSISESFGGRMNIGYTADQFGLISQLPQILNGFGLDSCVFGRGYKRGERQFYWQSEDGSTLLCEHMTNWYNSLERLPENPEDALQFIREKSGKCFENNEGSSSLLMNGCDHLDAQDDLTEIIENVSPLLSPDERLLQDTLPEYIDRLKSDIKENGTLLEQKWIFYEKLRYLPKSTQVY